MTRAARGYAVAEPLRQECLEEVREEQRMSGKKEELTMKYGIAEIARIAMTNPFAMCRGDRGLVEGLAEAARPRHGRLRPPDAQ